MSTVESQRSPHSLHLETNIVPYLIPSWHIITDVAALSTLLHSVSSQFSARNRCLYVLFLNKYTLSIAKKNFYHVKTTCKPTKTARMMTRRKRYRAARSGCRLEGATVRSLARFHSRCTHIKT
jgi:hypothetical protein